MMNSSLVLLTGCWIFAIFEDHLLDIFRIRKLSLIFYFGTLLLKITNMKRVRLFSPFVRLLSLLFCFFFFVPPFFLCNVLTFPRRFEKGWWWGIKLEVFCSVFVCVLSHLSKTSSTSFPIAQNQSIAFFADDDDDAKSTLVERIQPPLLRRKREGETSLFSSTRPKKNILSSSESSFLDHRSKKRSKRSNGVVWLWKD